MDSQNYGASLRNISPDVPLQYTGQRYQLTDYCPEWLTENLFDQYANELRQALTIRLTEQRLLELFSEGKLFGTVHTCIGQEFVGVSVARATQPQDTLFSNHRCHGHFLSYCGDVAALIGEVMGKSNGVCGGRGGSQHLHRENFFSNGIQGGIAPVSAGLACAHKHGETGGIAVVFLGDGTLGQGAVYESLNIASKWNLPVLFICENNLYAQSTNQEQTLAGSIADRAKAFGVRTAHSDTWNWPQLFEGIENSVEMVRANSQPIFHQVDTYRLMAHSKGDDDRPSEEVEPYWEKDPIEQLKKQYAGDPGWAKMLEEIQAEIDEAVSQSEASDFGNVQVIDTAPSSNALEWQEPTFEKQRIVAGVRQGLENALNGNEDVFLIGEDIESPYGGAFKCTLGLSDRFPGRVRNTPISEATIVGMGNGMAIKGMIPIVELMFGDFLALAADQWINHAAKFSWMYNDQVKMPVILRTPMGGKRGYAATHSQSIEKHFLGLPGTQVLCLHHRMCPTRLYDSLLANIDRPTLVIENKILYGHWADAQPPAGFQLLHTRESFPTANLKPQGTADLTIVSVGGMSRDVEEAAMDLFQNEEIAADLFMPTRLYPFDVACLEQSLSKTGRLLVVEEGQGFVSMSSEVLAQVAERFGYMNITPRRLAAAPVPIPASRPMEEQCLPGKQAVIDKAVEVMREFIH